MHSILIRNSVLMSFQSHTFKRTINILTALHVQYTDNCDLKKKYDKTYRSLGETNYEMAKNKQSHKYVYHLRIWVYGPLKHFCGPLGVLNARLKPLGNVNKIILEILQSVILYDISIICYVVKIRN